MNRQSWLLAVAIVGFIASGHVEAGTIVLSGDGNIGNAIDGSTTAFVNPDNSRFFRNVLGAGTKVRVYAEDPVTSIGTSTLAMHNLYSSLPGVTSAYDLSGSPVTSSMLSGLDLFIAHPFDSFLPSELTALKSFVDGPGTL